MSDDRLPRRDDGDGALLLYDHFKHLTTLSLVTLGGVLSISQGSAPVPLAGLVPVVLAVAGCGMVSFHAQDQIVRARVSGTTLPRSLSAMRYIASLSFGLGIGGFLAVFLEALR